jgi:DNA repair exonuclease SbcCD ATPase subunit
VSFTVATQTPLSAVSPLLCTEGDVSSSGAIAYVEETAMARGLAEFADKTIRAMHESDMQAFLDSDFSYSPSSTKARLASILEAHETTIADIQRVHANEKKQLEQKIRHLEEALQQFEWDISSLKELLGAQRRETDRLHSLIAESVDRAVRQEREAHEIEQRRQQKEHAQKASEIQAAWNLLLSSVEAITTDCSQSK